MLFCSKKPYYTLYYEDKIYFKILYIINFYVQVKIESLNARFTSDLKLTLRPMEIN